MNSKKIFFLILILFCHLGYTQTDTQTDNQTKPKRITLKANYADIINFDAENIGIKANTLGGSVEVKLFLKHNYDYKGGRKNPNLVFGFHSDNKNTGVFDKSSWIVESYWPWWALGGNNPFAFLNHADPYVEISSTDQQWVRKKIIKAYNEQFAVWNTDGVYDLGDGTMEFVLEIEFDLPQSVENYQYDIKLPGFDVLNEIDINLIESLKNTQYINNYRGIISSYLNSQTTTFVSMDYKGIKNMTIREPYSNSPSPFINRSGYDFSANYANGQTVSFFIRQKKYGSNSGDYTFEEANNMALEAATRFGKIPHAIRKATSTIIVLDGLFVGGYAQMSESVFYVAEDLNANTFLHEAIHVSHDILKFNPQWLFAYASEPGFVSDYEESKPIIESITESIPLWLYYKYNESGSPIIKAKIAQLMPNRLAFYDNYFSDDDMTPFSSPTTTPQLTYERFELTVQSTNQLLSPIDILVSRNDWATPIPSITQEVTLTLLVNGKVYKTIEGLGNNDNYQTTWTPMKSGVNTISGYITYADGFKSTIGLQNVTIAEPTNSNYHIVSPADKTVINDGENFVHFTIMGMDNTNPHPDATIVLYDAITGSILEHIQGNNTSELIVSRLSLFNYGRKHVTRVSGLYKDENGFVSQLNSVRLNVKNTFKPWIFISPVSHTRIPYTETITLVLQGNRPASDYNKITDVNIRVGNAGRPPIDWSVETSTLLPQMDYDFNPETLEISVLLQKPSYLSQMVIEADITIDGVVETSPQILITVEPQITNDQNKSAPNQDDKSSTSIDVNQLIIDKVIQDDILLYPNPTDNGSFKIAFNLKNGSDVYYDIFDISGRLVYKSKDNYYENGINEVSFENRKNQLSSGLYLVKLNLDGYTKVFKLIVE